MDSFQAVMADVKNDRNIFSKILCHLQSSGKISKRIFLSIRISHTHHLCQTGKLKIWQKKTDIITCLEDEVNTEYTNGTSEVGAAIVNILKQVSSKI